ncbi:TTLL3, partial [Symbiodinium sp. CCMP2456]
MGFAMFEDAYRFFSDESKQRIWIVKPAEWANRGCGIRIFKTIEEVRARVDAKERAWAIQKYIEKPLLVHGRKFDIRAYCLLLQDPTNWSFKAFYYRDAYLRTTSAQYTTKNLDRMVHLNNDAVQKHGDNYGKFESANKMSLD